MDSHHSPAALRKIIAHSNRTSGLCQKLARVLVCCLLLHLSSRSKLSIFLPVPREKLPIMVRGHTPGFVARSTGFWIISVPRIMAVTAFVPHAAEGLPFTSSFDLQKLLLQIGYKLFQVGQLQLVVPFATLIYSDI